MDTTQIRRTVLEAVEEAGLDRDDVVFVYVFGSYVSDEYNEETSDIDVCVSMDVEKPGTAGYRIQGRLPERFDLSVFEQLPVQVRKEVLEGQLIYSRSKDEVYDKAFETLEEYESFHPLYRQSIGATV